MGPQYGYDSTQDKGFFGNLKNHFVDFIQTLVVFGAIFALVYLFIAQPHKVSGNSMVPTFTNGDYIITDKLSYKLGEVNKGDIIVFKNPQDESQDFIKRIIAVPGDSIKIVGGQVYVNNLMLQEDYLPPQVPTIGRRFLLEGEEVRLADNQYIVFGDNREHSSDSREWGPIGKEKIIGKAFFRYFPPQSFGLIQHHSSN